MDIRFVQNMKKHDGSDYDNDKYDDKRGGGEGGGGGGLGLEVLGHGFGLARRGVTKLLRKANENYHEVKNVMTDNLQDMMQIGEAHGRRHRRSSSRAGEDEEDEDDDDEYYDDDDEYYDDDEELYDGDEYYDEEDDNYSQV